MIEKTWDQLIEDAIVNITDGSKTRFDLISKATQLIDEGSDSEVIALALYELLEGVQTYQRPSFSQRSLH